MIGSDEFSVPSLREMKLREEKGLRQKELHERERQKELHERERAKVKRRKERALREERELEEESALRPDVLCEVPGQKLPRRIPVSADPEESLVLTKKRKLENTKAYVDSVGNLEHERRQRQRRGEISGAPDPKAAKQGSQRRHNVNFQAEAVASRRARDSLESIEEIEEITVPKRPGGHPLEPTRRGRGRPKGSKNKPKGVPPVIESAPNVEYEKPRSFYDEDSSEAQMLPLGTVSKDSLRKLDKPRQLDDSLEDGSESEESDDLEEMEDVPHYRAEYVDEIQGNEVQEDNDESMEESPLQQKSSSRLESGSSSSLGSQEDNDESMEESPLQQKSSSRLENGSSSSLASPHVPRPKSSVPLGIKNSEHLARPVGKPDALRMERPSKVDQLIHAEDERNIQDYHQTMDKHAPKTSRIAIQPFLTPLDTDVIRYQKTIDALLQSIEVYKARGRKSAEEGQRPRQPEIMNDVFADGYVGLSKDCEMFWKLTPQDALPPGLQISIKENSLMARGQETTKWAADVCEKYHTCILLPPFQLSHSFFLYALQKVYINRLIVAEVDLPEFPETDFEADIKALNEDDIIFQAQMEREEAVRAPAHRDRLEAAVGFGVDPIPICSSSNAPFHMGVCRWIGSYQYDGKSSDIGLIEDDFEALIKSWDGYAAASLIPGSQWYKGQEAVSLGRKAFATRKENDRQERQIIINMRAKDLIRLRMKNHHKRLQTVNKGKGVGHPAVEAPTVSEPLLTMDVDPTNTAPDDTVRISSAVEPNTEVEVPTSSTPALTMDGNSSRSIYEDAAHMTPVVESNPTVAAVASQSIARDQPLLPSEELDAVEKVVLETIASDILNDPRTTVDVENSPDRYHVDDETDASMTNSSFDPWMQFWNDVDGMAQLEPEVMEEVPVEGSTESWRENSGSNIRVPLQIEFNV